MIVEDGAGLADADSYASVAEADAYLAARGRNATWATLNYSGANLTDNNAAGANRWVAVYNGTSFVDA